MNSKQSNDAAIVARCNSFQPGDRVKNSGRGLLSTYYAVITIAYKYTPGTFLTYEHIVCSGELLNTLYCSCCTGLRAEQRQQYTSCCARMCVHVEFHLLYLKFCLSFQDIKRIQYEVRATV